MMERTMLKLSVRDEFIVFQTYSRRNGRSSQFYMRVETLVALEQLRTVITLDDPHFVKMRTYLDRAGVERLCIQFTWLSVSGHDSVHGRREFLDVDYARFKAATEKSRAQQEAWQTLLTLPEQGKPPIRMHSKGNLKKVLQNRTLKKKLGRFLAANFRWESAFIYPMTICRIASFLGKNSRTTGVSAAVSSCMGRRICTRHIMKYTHRGKRDSSRARRVSRRALLNIKICQFK